MRKHNSQFSKDEKGFLHGFLRANVGKVNSVKVHFEDRATERHFTFEDALETIKSGLIVEVHNDRKPDVRVLVRGKNGTCVVVSLVTWEVITVYYNDPEDNHYGLNYNLYRWQVNAVNLVKELRVA
jgi:hypothetical protein